MSIAELSPLERATRLKKEADELLRDIELEKLTQAIGPLTPTGSYFLDTMIYPDIDLYLPPSTAKQLFDIALQLIDSQPVEKVNFLNGGPGEMKEGLYIKPVLAIGDWERSWKIDIWALPPDVIERKQAALLRYKEAMTAQQRELILNYKFSVLTDQKRTPVFSGIYVYQAVIDQGFDNFDQITDYLRENSIDL